MSIEQYANNAATTLNGAINNSVTSVVVTDASSFPASGNFRIEVDTEIMLVTAKASNTLTVTRGVEGTTAASHLDLAATTHVLTAASLLALPVTNILESSGPTLLTVGAIADGEFLQRVGSALVSSPGAWNKIVDNALSSLTGFTSQSGTWAINAGVIKQTNTAGRNRLTYNTQLPCGLPFIMECEVQLPTSSGTANRRVGIFTHSDSVGAHGSLGALNISTTSGSTIDGVHLELDNVANRADGTISKAIGAWIKIRFVVTGWAASLYVDGVFITSGLQMNEPSSSQTGLYIGFETNNVEGWYRNLKVWVPSLPN